MFKVQCLMGMEVFQFESLTAWIKAKELTLSVYRLVAKFPQHEQFALCSQIRRAAISIPSNIAEGSGRISMKEKAHFVEIAFGSLTETYCQLLLAVDLGYIATAELEAIKSQFSDTSRLMSDLRNSYTSKH